MTEICSDLDYLIYRSSDKSVATSYNTGKQDLKRPITNDMDAINAMLRGFLSHYRVRINAEPSQLIRDQEFIRYNFCEKIIDSLISSMKSQNCLINNNDLVYYYLGYVTDTITKQTSN